MATITLGDLSVGYDDVGQGGDVLLLIHGHPFNRTMWRPQLEALPETGWRVIAPDLRGYGETTVVPGKTLLSTFAADLAALLDALGIEEIVVGGLSMGGQIAMELCRQFPNRVRGLLLAATFPQADDEERRQWRYAMADRLVREGMHGYAHEVLSKMLDPRSIAALPAVAEHVMGMMRGTHPEGAAAALRGRAERPGYEATLASLHVPATVVVGTADAYTTRQDAESMRDLLATSELVWMNEIGHMPNLEAAAEFNAAVARLLERVRSRAAESADSAVRQ